jgi:maleylpyruvate isomerase
VVQGAADRLDGWMHTSTALPQIDETLLATTRYLQSLTELDEESVRGPSGLPGWSRAHVVAHLSRNADAFAQVVRQASAGEPAQMYTSNEDRDAEIEDTVTTLDLEALVEDAITSSARLTEAFWTCTADPGTPYSRVPGGEVFPLHTLGPRRRTEVEVHHCDLDRGYVPTRWPVDFARQLVKQRQDELATLPGGGPSMVLSATDDEGLWKLGAGPGPEIHGAVGDLAWWLVGRGGGRGLTCSPGDLPDLGRWR